METVPELPEEPPPSPLPQLERSPAMAKARPKRKIDLFLIF
jgi:hypothetical protein